MTEGKARTGWVRLDHNRAVTVGALAAVLVAALFVLPSMLSSYWITVLTTVAMLAILAQSWNIITGFAGYPAFGNIAFFGIGAYTVGMLTAKHPLDLPYPVMLGAAGLAAALVCLILGGPLMRTRGHYFAIGTIGLAAALQQITYVVPELTTSSAGSMVLPTFGTLFGTIEQTAYYWMVGTLILCTIVATWVSHSRLGFGLKSIRADEIAAATYGVPTISFKVAAWVISAAFCGIAGGIWATWIGVISPSSAYDLGLAVQYAVIALIGGLGTISGPLIGAVVVGLVSQLIWVEYPALHLLVMGVIVMVAVLLFPEGFVGSVRRIRERGGVRAAFGRFTRAVEWRRNEAGEHSRGDKEAMADAVEE